MAREAVMVEEGSWDGAYDGDIECDSVESIMWKQTRDRHNNRDRPSRAQREAEGRLIRGRGAGSLSSRLRIAADRFPGY
jgi:hypothetical protein